MFALILEEIEYTTVYTIKIFLITVGSEVNYILTLIESAIPS